MLDMKEIDRLAERFGGRYKLIVLIQKRLKELVKGGQKLVESEERNLIKVVLQEIAAGKVSLEGPKAGIPAPSADEGPKTAGP